MKRYFVADIDDYYGSAIMSEVTSGSLFYGYRLSFEDAKRIVVKFYEAQASLIRDLKEEDFEVNFDWGAINREAERIAETQNE